MNLSSRCNSFRRHEHVCLASRKGKVNRTLCMLYIYKDLYGWKTRVRYLLMQFCSIHSQLCSRHTHTHNIHNTQWNRDGKGFILDDKQKIICIDKRPIKYSRQRSFFCCLLICLYRDFFFLFCIEVQSLNTIFVFFSLLVNRI